MCIILWPFSVECQPQCTYETPLFTQPFYIINCTYYVSLCTSPEIRNPGINPEGVLHWYVFIITPARQSFNFPSISPFENNKYLQYTLQLFKDWDIRFTNNVYCCIHVVTSNRHDKIPYTSWIWGHYGYLFSAENYTHIKLYRNEMVKHKTVIILIELKGTQFCLHFYNLIIWHFTLYTALFRFLHAKYC